MSAGRIPRFPVIAVVVPPDGCGMPEEFSGILCVDEVYQGQLALLLAVDPAALSGDRLVGYQLVTGTVDRETVDGFLTRLKEARRLPGIPG